MKEISNPKFRCVGGACPNIYQKDSRTAVVVGVKLSANSLDMLGDRISEAEVGVEIPLRLLRALEITPDDGEE